MNNFSGNQEKGEDGDAIKEVTAQKTREKDSFERSRGGGMVMETSKPLR